MDSEKTGQLIAACRKEKRLTQKELAAKLGVTNKAISKWETGQGMPDISMLLKLSEILEVSVEELLSGEKTEKEILKSAEPAEIPPIKTHIKNVCMQKLKTIHIGKWTVIGTLLFAAAAVLLAVQLWYAAAGKRYGAEYIWDWMFWGFNGCVFILFYLGGMCLKRLRKLWKHPLFIAVMIGVFGFNILFGVITPHSVRSIVSISPDMSTAMVLKENTSDGKVTVYRNRRLWFVKPAESFPFSVDEMKLQWLTGDACAVTYVSPDDGGLHQYVVTYGDRGGGISYYYVQNAILGQWYTDDNEYALNVMDGTEGGIYLTTPEGEEFYSYDQCMQYGTLALVFPREEPKWTLVMNKDCEIDSGTDLVKEGGTLTLCRVSMDKTAPILLNRVNKGGV